MSLSSESGLLLVCPRAEPLDIQPSRNNNDQIECSTHLLPPTHMHNVCKYQSISDPRLWTLMIDLGRVPSNVEAGQNTNIHQRLPGAYSVLYDTVNSIECKLFKQLCVCGVSEGPAPVVTCVSFVVKNEHVEEVNRWYNQV